MTTPTTTKKPKKPMPTQVDRDPQPYTGEVKIDATAVAALLRDLPPGAMQGLRKPGANIAAVVAELAASVPAYGAAAGISTATYQSFTTHTANIAQLTALGAGILKLAEVITESLALEEDAQDQAVGQIVDAINSTIKRTKSAAVGAPFQQTLTYRSEAGKKAAATREKKAAAKAATPAAAAPAAPAASATPGH